MNVDQKMRPPYVRFGRIAVEDRTQAAENGKYGFRDMDIAKITVPGQKDTVEREVEPWLKDLEKQAEDGRIPAEWPIQFRKGYGLWKQGQDVPLNGTPIKGWPLLPPSQQELLIMNGIATVEDLAAANDEAMRYIGTGAMTLKNKAVAWLQEGQSKGSVAEEIATLKRDNESLAGQVKDLLQAVTYLKGLVPPEKLTSQETLPATKDVF